MRKTILFISIFYFIFSCSGVEKKAKENVKRTVPRDYKAELNQYFSTNYLSVVKPVIKDVKIDSIAWIHKFYNNIDHSTIWITDSIQLSEAGIRLIDQLSNAKNYGLDTRWYKTNTLIALKKGLDTIQLKDKKYATASELEVLLTYYFMQHGKHLNYGVLGSITNLTEMSRKKFNLNLPDYLNDASKSDSIIEKLLDLQPKHVEYRNLQKGLEKFLENTSSLSTDNVNVQVFRKDSLKTIKQAKKALVLHQYLTDEQNDSLYFNALTKFQTEHGLKPDSLIGKNTAIALSVSPYEYYKKIVTNLERWRWRDDWSSSDYIYVNIPRYKMQLYKNGKQSREHKVVVGSFKNQTPEIIDTLEYIIAYPYWNVPRKISVKEILGKVQKDSTYLIRNNYEVFDYSRKTIEPNSVNWNEINNNNFKYFIRQKGGNSNALGLVKFIFPNKRAIYFHDTPSKRYFKREYRAYSHGCVRVDKALDLADYLLKSDNNKYTIDNVYEQIKKKKQKSITLNTKLPVYIYYTTASADNLGNITFYNDIYKKDKTLINTSTELAINSN
ncbi:MAG: L,D-transpeptidase family protein [Flavobacteriaceae bacterium]|nr:L,D-transpeptidase family protein [Flavobacteriaceae bacterium]